jgi:2-polyprenyl-3-methyl-5-hydroxy-6-metoxy-1,4-benzoquinol methylase
VPEACGCLLCNSSEIAVLEELSTSDIVRCYEESFEPALSAVKQSFQGHRRLNYCHCKQCDLRYFSPPVAGTVQYYNALQKLPWYYLEDKPEYQVAKKWISSADQVLEVGCGSGAFSRHINGTRYTGLEISDEALRSAAQHGLHVENGSIEQHVVGREGQYDVICAFQVLEHIAPVHDFIAASVRGLRIGGMLIYCVPSEESYISLLQNANLNLPPHHVTRWTDAALKSIARLFPLELVAIEHERLADFHKSTYTYLLMLRTLSRVLRRKRKNALLDLSRGQRFLSSIAWRLGRILEKGLDDSILLPRGHSVTAVFRKSVG